MPWVKWFIVGLNALFSTAFFIGFIYYLRDYLILKYGKKKKVFGFLREMKTQRTSIRQGRQVENIYCYGYTVEGKTYEGEARVSDKDDDHSPSQFEIEYLVSNPQNHILIGIGTIQRTVIIGILAFGFLLFLAAAIMSCLI